MNTTSSQEWIIPTPKSCSIFFAQMAWPPFFYNMETSINDNLQCVWLIVYIVYFADSEDMIIKV